jgi:hypothetical protein
VEIYLHVSVLRLSRLDVYQFDGSILTGCWSVLGGKKGKMGEWKQQSAIPCLSVVFNSHASLGWELPFICRLQSLFLLNPLESSLDYMKRPRQLLWSCLVEDKFSIQKAIWEKWPLQFRHIRRK